MHTLRPPGRTPPTARQVALGGLLGLGLLAGLSCGLLGVGATGRPGVSLEAGVVGLYLLANDPRSGQPDPDNHWVGLRAGCHRAPRFSRMLGDQHLVLWSCP